MLFVDIFTKEPHLWARRRSGFLSSGFYQGCPKRIVLLDQLVDGDLVAVGIPRVRGSFLPLWYTRAHSQQCFQLAGDDALVKVWGELFDKAHSIAYSTAVGCAVLRITGFPAFDM